ncbi:hypothetical protein BGW80DRAFT_1197232 [Lactifluus volemus]|nr:hypothetical protein BGW80DRAFT_1197232 [Lactifluus volemus]
MPRKDNANTPASAQAQQDAVSEGIENFELPRALVTRIARSAVPENVKLQKDTVLSLVKGATVFINYLGAAHEVSTSKQHKSISASDVFKALEHIEFADLIPPLQAELQGTLLRVFTLRYFIPSNTISLSRVGQEQKGFLGWWRIYKRASSAEEIHRRSATRKGQRAHNRD